MSGDFPSADTVAALIVEACVETGEDPLAAANPREVGIVARGYVLAALWSAWPDLPVARLSRLCGYSQPRAPSHIAAARAGRSWKAGLESRLTDSAEELRRDQGAPA